jgi:hypothetical protein
MKTGGLHAMLGKTVTGVIVKRARTNGLPPSQVFLILSDGTYLELWGDFNAAGGLDSGGVENARGYMAEATEIVFEAHL